MTNRILTFTFSVLALCVALPAAAAGATPPDGDVVRTDLANGDTATPVSIIIDGPATQIVQSLGLAPGASSGWHTHPGTELSVITAGSVALQVAGTCVPATYGAGQAVAIPAGVPHRVANETGAHADVVVTYTLPVGAPVREDAPDVCAH